MLYSRQSPSTVPSPPTVTDPSPGPSTMDWHIVVGVFSEVLEVMKMSTDTTHPITRMQWEAGWDTLMSTSGNTPLYLHQRRVSVAGYIIKFCLRVA